MASDAPPLPHEAGQPLTLVGLCAQWCGVCREFQPGFAAVVDGIASAGRLQARWLDVEEGAVSDALGDVDVETFPTVAIGRGGTLLFWGDIVPSMVVLERLLAELASHDARPAALPPAQRRAWQALQALPR